MQGSIDHPPITIGMDRKAAYLGFIGGLIIMAASWYFGRQQTFGFFAACMSAFLCAAILLTLPHMEISAEGLSWGNRLGRKAWPWSDFEMFEVREIPLFGLSCVGCRFSATHPGGPDGIIGILWEMRTPELVVLLNEARRRWTRMPLVGASAIE